MTMSDGEMSDGEMSDEVLRTRLSRIDPAPAGSPVDPVTSPRASELMERAMQADHMQTDRMQTDHMQTIDPPAPPDELAPRRRRRPLLLAAAAAVLIALVGGGSALWNRDAPSTGDPSSTLALELPAPDATASCKVFDVDVLAQMPVALAGTVATVEPGQVALDVDHWYRGGTADRVTIAVRENMDGVDFRTGGRYLISAIDGTVTSCGLSGAATPELERAFAEAFGG
ncbi:MAG: hypothetical protein JWQ99_2656 [Blastococcus sp.]|nr:hypothetical protein [Blastococcus sp.]